MLDEKQRQKILRYVEKGKFVGALNLVSEYLDKDPDEIVKETETRVGEVLGEDSIENVSQLIQLGLESRNPTDFYYAVKLIIDRAREIREKSVSNEKSSKKPLFYELPEPMSSYFGREKEELAKEVFENKSPFEKWNEWVSQNTIPSASGFLYFADERIRHLRKKAKDNLENRISLTEGESNAYYYKDRSREESVKLAERISREKHFSHLIEQFAAKIIAENLDEVGADEVYFASKGEDIYCGADVFVRTKQGAWFAIDFTVARSEDIKRKKESRENIFPKNLFEFLVKRGELRRESENRFKIPRVPIYLPREIYIDAVYRFFLEMKLGNEKKATEIAQSIFKRENRSFEDHLDEDIAKSIAA